MFLRIELVISRREGGGGDRSLKTPGKCPGSNSIVGSRKGA